jgi:UDP-N-acetylglucosamine--N-acetylmuramyl-(pentapeptide) pyrophosphoryl-undecaprenol N-acetylglucosamine transferase
MNRAPSKPSVAIACGGTGGHLFPGLAVAGQLRQRDCSVTLLISPKEVDQQAVQAAREMRVVTLPAAALQTGSRLAFVRGFVQSYRAAKQLFRETPTAAVLGMGGFTSAPPMLAARRRGAAVFLHESNAIPGRANRWLARIVDRAFVGFPSSSSRLRCRNTTVTGTPTRPEFVPRPAASARLELGLDADRPVVLVVGGSQGASGLNDAVLAALPLFAERRPETQWIHLTGARDVEKVQSAYAKVRLSAWVLPFCHEMDRVLAAATVAVSRAGASCLAELAAMRTPAVLVPFPAAADNHQWHNARQFEETGAARLLEQEDATPTALFQCLGALLADAPACERVRVALERWQSPRAAAEIADCVLKVIAERHSAPEFRVGEAGASTPVRHSSVIA